MAHSCQATRSVPEFELPGILINRFYSLHVKSVRNEGLSKRKSKLITN